jgi:hypothetical protein
MRKAKLLAILLLTGCAHNGIRPLRPLEIATAPYQQVATAALTGSLMYEGACLLFRDEASGAIVMPVWPIGSSFNGTSVTFHEPAKADQRIMVAEEFQMSGQPLQWTTLAAPYYLPFHRYCAAQPFFVSEIRPAN